MQKKHIFGYAGTALVALLIGVAAGGGSGDESSTSNAAAEPKTETVTVAAEPEVKTKTVTRTVTEKAKAPEKKAGSSSSKKFSGNGGKTLPPIEVTEASTLKWTNDGEIFQVFPKDMDSSLTINSQAGSGETHVEPGTYTLDVNAMGNWTIEIVPAN